MGSCWMGDHIKSSKAGSWMGDEIKRRIPLNYLFICSSIVPNCLLITLPAQPQGTVSCSFLLSFFIQAHAMHLYSVFLWFFLSYTGAFTCACILFFYGSSSSSVNHKT